MTRRWLRGAAATAVAIVAAYVMASLLVPRFVDADRFRPEVERRLAEALGAPVAIGPLALSLWLGPVVAARELRVGGVAGPDARVEAETVSVRLALLPLLVGSARPSRLDVDGGTASRGGTVWVSALRSRARLRLEPRGWVIRGMASGRADAAPGAPDVEARFGVLVAPGRATLERLTIASGRVTADVSGTIDHPVGGSPTARLAIGLAHAETRAQGNLDLRLRDDSGGSGGPLERVAGAGILRVERGRFAGLDVTGLASDIRVDGGTATFENASFALDDGRGRARLEAHFAESRMPMTLDATLEGVDVRPVVAAFSDEVGRALEGRANLTMRVAVPGIGPGDYRDVRGRIGLSVSDGRVKTIGLMKRVAELLEMAGGKVIGREETPFDELAATFEVGGGRATSRDLRFRSADLDLDGGGIVSVDGALDFDVLSTFSRTATADLVKGTPQLRFRVGDDGRLSVPMKVRGKIAAPEVQLDVDRVLRDALRRELRREGGKDLLRRLLHE